MLRNVAFALLLLGTALGLDFHLKSKTADGPYEISDYLAGASEQLSDVSKAWDKHFNAPGLREALPSDLADWEVHPFDTDDLVILLGRAPTELETKKFKELKGQLNFAVASTRGVKAMDRAYYRGDIGIRLTAMHISAKGMIGKAMKRAAIAEEMSGLSDNDVFPFAEVDGVMFREMSAQNGDGIRLRYIFGKVSDSIAIRLTTASYDNAAIAELLAAVDFQMLNALLAEPLPEIVDSPPRLFAETDAAAIGRAANGSEPAPIVDLESAELSSAGKVDDENTNDETAASIPTAYAPCVRKAGVLKCADG